MDTELFELCKEVYKRTEWDDKGNCPPLYRHWWKHHGQPDSSAELCTYMGTIDPREPAVKICPLYTSDYLLEKLPLNVEMRKYNDGYGAREIGTGKFYGEDNISDSLVKALLKLVIALDDAGVKL